MLRKAITLITLASACLGAGNVVATERKPIPIPGEPEMMTFDNLRAVQYCEMWLFKGTPETGIAGVYFNTSNLNNSADKLDTCPPALFDKITVESLVASYDVIAAYKNVLRQLDERAILEMERENVTVAEKIAQVREMLEQKKKLRFTDLVRLSPARTHVVVLMLALLELARMRDVRLRQDGLFSEIWIIRKAAAHEPS